MSRHILKTVQPFFRPRSPFPLDVPFPSSLRLRMERVILCRRLVGPPAWIERSIA
jgi:hypothetical protein